ncbi:sensor histidine kinase [Salinactinospora qingdaonensis]|uniref:histidine kinase n=1 Tax=Salinactinospora qingdaonensis TaxID=702744 RepID=A0ABP7GKJ7_9ACTN
MDQSGSTDRSIRYQLNRIVLIPSITFLLLFAVLSAATLLQASALRSATSDGRSIVHLYRALTALQQERRLAAADLAASSDQTRRAFNEQVTATDEAVRELDENSAGLREADDSQEREAVTRFFTELRGRTALRDEIIDAGVDRATAVRRYSQIIDSGIGFAQARTDHLPDGPAVAQNAVTVDLVRAHERFAQADTALTSAIVLDQLPAQEQSEFISFYTGARRLIDSIGPRLRDDPAQSYTDLLDSPQWEQTDRIAGTVMSAQPEFAVDPVTGEQNVSRPLPPGVDDWRDAAEGVSTALLTLTEKQTSVAIDVSDQASTQMFTLALGGGILAMFAGTLAYGVASRSANLFIRRLVRLRRDTLRLAQEELPRIIERLQNGDPLRAETELRKLDYGTDEIGQVADAFNVAQRTAVAAAIKQAEIRTGANRVFLGIAHRNQSLVQRQLQLLDRIEREEDDPDLMEDLFQLDHLATRGRRNAENLIILGGAQPGRRWRNPIPLVDILRGAISETEEYARVKLRIVPELALRGTVVADVIHLVAELIENATAFSPPHTKVHLHSEVVPKGVIVEIEDRGLGMSEEDYAKANQTLSNAPEFDVMAINEDSRLGLFVVARLAAKHDISVRLASSPYGGTRAIVLIPTELTAPSTTSPRGTPSLRATKPALESTPDSNGSGDLLAGQSGDTAGLATPAAVSDNTDTAPVTHQDHTEQSPRTAQSENATAPDPPPPESAQPTTGGSEPAAPAPPASDDRPPLPRRRRQANLAPQLRHDGQPLSPPITGQQPSLRTPEDVRRTLSAFQSGTRRGRAADSTEIETGIGEGDHGDAPHHNDVAPTSPSPRHPASTNRYHDGQTGRSVGDHTEESE